MRRTLALFAVLLPACSIDGRPDLTTTGPGSTAGLTSGGSSSSTSAGGDSTVADASSGTSMGDGSDGDDSSGSTSTSSTGSTSTDTTGSTETTGAEVGTSTGESTGSTGGESSSSTGEPEPAPVCGDGVCDPAERAPCWSWTADDKWGPGFCYIDCGEDPACVAVLDCACTPEAAAVFGWCDADPLPACGATAPGGVCSISDVLAFYEWHSKCG